MKSVSSFAPVLLFASTTRSTSGLIRKSVGYVVVALLVLATSTCLFAQTGGWVWTGGSNTIPGSNYGNDGIYGTLGVPAAGNIPGGREYGAYCTDASGNFWMFGGYGYDSAGTFAAYLNDLWEFSPSTNQWAWMGGSSTHSGFGQKGVYGTLGVGGPGNAPGGRDSAACWIDSVGNLWLFGGTGYDSNGSFGYLNDLWQFNSSTGWTWVGGSNSLPNGYLSGQPGVYGTLEAPAAGNAPGGRSGAVAWTDPRGNFWLFGGMGFDSADTQGNLNDLWEFSPSSEQWVWMSGSSTVGGSGNQSGVYGAPGVPASGNVPGGRRDATGWTDSGGNLWLFGGFGAGASTEGWLNDFWEFNSATLEWTWMGGSSGQGQSGSYGSIGTPAPGNIPGARESASAWTDSGGNLWLFGGYGYAAGSRGDLNDLWEFNPFTSQWTWISGSNTIGSSGGQPGAYGTLGVIASGNTPGSREAAMNWIDGHGNLWLFGGSGYVGPSTAGYLNDVWEYQPSVTALPPASAPNFSIAAGTYTTAQQVSITDSTPGATIYYTTDGTTPNLNSGVYSGPLTVSATETIRAVATAPNYSQSLVSSATYIIKPQAASPTFSLASGTYWTTQTLSIADGTPGATIYYTTDGTPPTIYSNVYTGPITVSSTETVQAIAMASGYTSSAVTSATYVITLPAATPVFSLPSGTYSTTLTVTISDATPGATIFYTTDGVTPNEYTGPITVSSTETIEAAAIAAGYAESAAASVTYTIAPPPPGFSPSSGSFGAENTSSTSPVQTLTYTFGAPVTLGSTAVLTQGALGLDFADAGTGTCAANTAYAVGQTCTVNVTFRPKFAGARNGAVELNDTNGNVIATAYLQGIGVGPQLNFYPGTQTTLGSSFGFASGVAVDGNGNAYVVDVINNRGNLQEILAVNGTIPATPTIRTLISGLDDLTGPALDAAGNVYFVDLANHTVNEIQAVNGSIPASPKIVTLTSQFGSPVEIAVDGSGNVYVTDASNNTVNEILAVNGSIPTSPTITTLASGFKELDGMTVDANGNVYVSDDTSREVFQIHAVNGSIPASPLITSLGSGFVIPRGIAVDINGNVYVAEYFHGTVYKLLAVNGSVPASPTIQTLGTGLLYASGVTVDGSGNVFVADYGDARLVRLDYADPPSLSFASTAVGAGSADSPQTVTMENVGNADLTFPVPSTGANPSMGADFTLNDNAPDSCLVVNSGSSAAGTLAAGASCALSISFMPSAAGSLNESLLLTDNNLNAAAPGYSTQSISLSGSGIATPTITWSAPAPITYGAALSSTQLNATASVAGTFSYSPAAGTVLGAGTQTLTVTFTPTDATDYTTATATVMLTVNQATPTIAWPTPASIAVGTPLGAAQLDATASVAGTFAYTPAAGTVLAAGNQTLTAVFTPADSADYNTATASVVLAVIGSPSFTLSATSSSPAVVQGKSAADTVIVSGQNGFNSSVRLSASGQPAGVTVAFGTNPTTGSSALTFTASASAVPGTYLVTVKGVSGSLSATTTITLTVHSGFACHVGYSITKTWVGEFQAALNIKNTGTGNITDWTLTWTFANGQTIETLWNGNETQSGANVTVTDMGYNGTIKAGGSYNGAGLTGTWNNVTNAIPTNFAINGTPCQ